MEDISIIIPSTHARKFPKAFTIKGISFESNMSEKMDSISKDFRFAKIINAPRSQSIFQQFESYGESA